jgi:tetratricopeptide (TPR) repeat protein
MGRHQDALDEAVSNRRSIDEELATRPGDTVFLSDLAVCAQRLMDLRLAAADTAGAVEECRTNVNIAEALLRTDPTNAYNRRAALIACAKLAHLQSVTGRRDSALASYLRAERFAVEAVRTQPENTDASRDLSIVYGMRGLFHAENGDLDSALVVYGRGMAISEDLAAKDPDNVLQQTDLADGHLEIGEMLMKLQRYREVEERAVDAFQRYSRIAAADSTNVGARIQIARSCRRAGEACFEQSKRAASAEERRRTRERALDWLERSRDLYTRLKAAGALVGEDAALPSQLERQVGEVRRAGSG